jgi:hypothetical protein
VRALPPALLALLALLALPGSVASCQSDDTAYPADAAFAADTTGGDAASGCPALAPDAGAPCSAPATVDCVYGSDTYCHPIAWSCTSSGWQTATPAPPPECPASAPGEGTPCLQCTPEGHACPYDAGCVATCTAQSWALSAACGLADAGEDSSSDAGGDASVDAGADAGADASADAGSDASTDGGTGD